ncbi:MAG: DUF1553 domain-containing protein [Lentisphaerales bacterium]|nr:DUF1553 domain-containing protein [Lentisphaerales bacterium]
MFSKTIVNRLWKKVMGIELIGDVMDLQIKERGTNPALTEKLVQMMKYLNFDTKAFLSVLYRTQAYQSEITKKELTPGEDYHFPGPVLRRLSAEQLWDSMSSILYEKPDEFLNQPKAHVEHLIYEKVKNTETAQLIEYFKTIAVTDKSIYENFGTYKHQGKKLRGFQRASDLLAPTRPDHFLSEFGASDRRQIESSSSEPTIPQALYLMNSGYIEGSIVRKPTTLLNQALSSTKDHSTKIETLSLGLLCRLPTSTEKSKMRKHLKEFGIQGQFDILWALLNSNEFKFYK